MNRLTIIVMIIGALVLAGCDGGDGTTSAATSDQATNSTSSTDVTIKNFAFMPETIEVPAGTTITWTNQDDFAHTVTSGTPDEQTGRFDSELGSLGEHAASGTMATFTAEEPGEISYFCRFHPRMKGTIVVTEES